MGPALIVDKQILVVEGTQGNLYCYYYTYVVNQAGSDTMLFCTLWRVLSIHSRALSRKIQCLYRPRQCCSALSLPL